jgi:hypothetical protein
MPAKPVGRALPAPPRSTVPFASLSPAQRDLVMALLRAQEHHDSSRPIAKRRTLPE